MNEDALAHWGEGGCRAKNKHQVQAGQSTVRNPAGARYFGPPKSSILTVGSPPAACSVSAGFLSQD